MSVVNSKLWPGFHKTVFFVATYNHRHAVFGRRGLVLNGDTDVRERKELVSQFQEDETMGFFVHLAEGRRRPKCQISLPEAIRTSVRSSSNTAKGSSPTPGLPRPRNYQNQCFAGSRVDLHGHDRDQRTDVLLCDHFGRRQRRRERLFRISTDHRSIALIGRACSSDRTIISATNFGFVRTFVQIRSLRNGGWMPYGSRCRSSAAFKSLVPSPCRAGLAGFPAPVSWSFRIHPSSLRTT
jgi:hypothetical protein